MSNQPHFGYIDTDRAYRLEELSNIMGAKDLKNLRMQLRDELKIKPKKILGQNWYSGRLLVLAIERASQEFNEDE